MLRFRFLGFPVFIEPWFWLLAAFVSGAVSPAGASSSGIILVLVKVVFVFISILAHELGHALANRYFNREAEIELNGMGGICFSRGATLSRPKSIVVSAAGPAVSLGLAILFWALINYAPLQLSNISPYLLAGAVFACFANIFWTLFNLLPVLPMDGGQIFRDVMGPRHFRTVEIIGGVVAILVAVLAFSFGIILGAIFLAFLAFSNFRGTPPQGGVAMGPR
jgi:Zn-dependent protease